MRTRINVLSTESPSSVGFFFFFGSVCDQTKKRRKRKRRRENRLRVAVTVAADRKVGRECSLRVSEEGEDRDGSKALRGWDASLRVRVVVRADLASEAVVTRAVLARRAVKASGRIIVVITRVFAKADLRVDGLELRKDHATKAVRVNGLKVVDGALETINALFSLVEAVLGDITGFALGVSGVTEGVGGARCATSRSRRVRVSSSWADGLVESSKLGSHQLDRTNVGVRRSRVPFFFFPLC